MIRGEYIVFLGIGIIIIGILVLFLGSTLSSSGKEEGTTKVKSGGVILIGPIPIIFGTDRTSTIIAVGLALLLMVVSYLLFYRRAI